ncbi:MAG: hypothetical protein O3A47_13670 [Chloroflexi bacterium]|nr:hypothetical protein [Chloroflexota bacterium]
MSGPQLFAIQGMHGQCVQPLGEVFSHHLGQRAVGDVAFVDQTTYGEFIHSVSGSAGQDRCLCSFAVEAMRSRSVLDISMRLIFALLGRSEDSEQVLSEEDVKRVEPVFRDALAEVQRAWEPVLPTVIGDMKIETNQSSLRLPKRVPSSCSSPSTSPRRIVRDWSLSPTPWPMASSN